MLVGELETIGMTRMVPMPDARGPYDDVCNVPKPLMVFQCSLCCGQIFFFFMIFFGALEIAAGHEEKKDVINFYVSNL